MPDKADGLVDDPAQDGYVETEQLRLLFAHTAAGTVIATFFALLLARHLSKTISQDLLITWVGLKIAIAIPRIAQAMIFRRSGTTDPKRYAFWTDALLLIDGILWGLLGLITAQTSVIDAAVVEASLCCVACVATFGLQVRLKATMAYVVPIIGLTALGLAKLGGEFGYMSAAGLALALVLMLSTSARSERRLTEIFKLRVLTQQISQERAEALLLAKLESDRKSRFVATVSHEIRTPLHGILGLAALVRQSVPHALERERIDLITSSGQHLLRLVNDLLDLAKFESGTLRLERTTFSLVQEMEQLSVVYTARASQANVHLHTRLSLPSNLWVESDPSRLRQVLENLLGNSIKFTPRGGTVTFEVSHSPDDEIVFAVTDTGPGIAPEDLARLFVPYQQVSDERMAKEGTGLGLAIARDLVKLMGGSIECDSKVGEGSTFRVRLPMLVVPEPPRPAAPPPAASVTPAARAKAHTILLVDDDEVSAMVGVAALEQAGWRVETATRGAEAVGHCNHLASRPSLVLMDCDMPGIDGLEATRQIRQWESEQQLKPMVIVALTGRADRAEHRDCIAAGMDHVLTKPFSMAALVVAIDVLLPEGPNAPETGRWRDSNFGLSAFGLFDTHPTL